MMISTARSRWEVFRLPEELKKLISYVMTTIWISPIKAVLIAIVVLAGGIAGRCLLPRTHSYYHPVDLAAAKS
jgi:hypothetical protein